MINPAANGNTSFSSLLPGMQLAVDSTSLGAFKTCPRFYQYSILEGWSPRDESVHLTFGLLLHKALEIYQHCRAEGKEHDDAMDATLVSLGAATWNYELGRTSFLGEGVKNRLTLFQTVVWYLDALAAADPIETLLLANGKPAVELSFRFDSGLRTQEGEEILFCGHLDRIGRLGAASYIVDPKTSSMDVRSPRWYSQFSPGNQFSLYTIAGKVAFEVEVAGVIADGIQVGVGFARFHRVPIARSQSQLEEWLQDAAVWIGGMELAARKQHWPLNDKSCGLFGGCPFREVCGRSPGAREQWLRTNYVKRVWDPLQVRGEV